MNSLPPELLSSIVDLAADCSSIYDSWDTRMDTLLYLTLVNRQFHGIAQPLLPQQLYLKGIDHLAGEALLKKFVGSGLTTKVKSLTFELKLGAYYHNLRMLSGLENLTELRVKSFGEMSLQALEAHPHLSRIALYDGSFCYDPPVHATISLRSVIELTLRNVTLVIHDSRKAGATSPLLSESHFPSLRALGLKDLRGRSSGMSEPLFSASLIARLDCLTTDDKSIPFATRNPLPVPHLLDIRFEASDDALYPYYFVSKPPSPSHTHLRIRLPCESISSYQRLNSALYLAGNLVRESTSIEELYLDLYPRDGRRGYVLEEGLEEMIEKLEVTAREKNIEIIWENQEDDWCRSRVSKEFWKRCKAKKEKEFIEH
ncbi:hypothetical protein JCM3765_004869 [Sporobolomyces pararoseus]